jgi:hypothetical protein
MGVKWGGRERLVWAKALYFREGCEVVWLGRFGMWGLEEASGWLRKAVERVRGRQG